MKVLFAVVLALASLAPAAPGQHRFIANCYSQGVVRIITKDESVEWEFDGLKAVQDSWVLDGGNYLFSCKNGVREISPDNTVVWEYNAAPGVEVHSVQPLPGNKVLVCECGSRRLIEIARGTGTITREIPLRTDLKTHVQFRTARKTDRGTYWVAFIGEGKIKEVDQTGTILNEFIVSDGHKNAHGIDLLSNGNVLASSANGGGIVEFDPQGKKIWEVTRDELLAAGLTEVKYTGGLKRLGNGNTVVSVYGGDPQFFEITADKQIVWTFNNPQFGRVAGFCLLD